MSTNLSVAVATYNESHNIKKFLDNLSWVSNINIVDGSSTDDTVQIARQYKNVKITITDNKPIFHINKQLAIDACTTEWILQLDADEIVSDKLKEEILDLINSSDKKANGYWIKRKNYFLGRFLQKGGQYPDPVIRLFKKGKGKLPCRSVHEQISITGQIDCLTNDLLHFADTSFSRYLKRNNRYTSLMADDLKKAGVKINIFNFFIFYFIKPTYWFLKTYFRHKGFMDGFAGFVFSFFSALSYPISYIKLYELSVKNRQLDIKHDWDQ